MMASQHRDGDPSQQIAYCGEKHRLINEFLATNHVLIDLQNQQVQSVIEQDTDFARFDDLIHVAKEQKDQAKYALIAHVEEHHC
jgi:hypothetical protein